MPLLCSFLGKVGRGGYRHLPSLLRRGWGRFNPSLFLRHICAANHAQRDVIPTALLGGFAQPLAQMRRDLFQSLHILRRARVGRGLGNGHVAHQYRAVFGLTGRGGRGFEDSGGDPLEVLPVFFKENQSSGELHPPPHQSRPRPEVNRVIGEREAAGDAASVFGDFVHSVGARVNREHRVPCQAVEQAALV